MLLTTILSICSHLAVDCSFIVYIRVHKVLALLFSFFIVTIKYEHPSLKRKLYSRNGDSYIQYRLNTGLYTFVLYLEPRDGGKIDGENRVKPFESVPRVRVDAL